MPFDVYIYLHQHKGVTPMGVLCYTILLMCYVIHTFVHRHNKVDRPTDIGINQE
jgi:hypothetical protein